MISIQPVKTKDDSQVVAHLAREIWNEHFVPIIGQQQVDYMLDQFQSPHAINSQLQSGFEYYLALQDEIAQGYLGLLPDMATRRMMISKIYIRNSARGYGLGNFLLDFVKQQSLERQIEKIWLTVNRHNDATLAWYKRKGFMIVDEVKKDIGNGFYMDDYIMELNVE